MSEIGSEMSSSRPENALGRGERRALETPVSTEFGAFSTKIEFEKGCKPEDVLKTGGVVSFTTKEQFTPIVETIRYGAGPKPDRPYDEAKTEILIGKTPEGFQMPLESEQNAGDPGEYLLHQKTKRISIAPDGKTVENEVDRYTYLDAADLKDVVLEKKKMPIFGLNKERHRNIRIQGKVQSVESFDN